MTPPGLRFDGTVRIEGAALLGPASLTAAPAAWTCLLGPSGIGKSTLLRAFAGIGEGVEVDGQAVATDKAPLQDRIAMMAQTDLLLPWLTVAENATLGARMRGQMPDAGRLEDILARMGLTDLRTRKPARLSGGQRQRAALARTLMEDRPVVLLDEPFSALDVSTKARMQELACSELVGRTVLHVTHDPTEAARLADQTWVLTRAGAIACPPPATPAPRAPDAVETLAYAGQITRALLVPA